MIIDFKLLNTKEKFLKYMQEHLEDMYDLNYDALIDAITMYRELTLCLKNIDSYEDLENLKDIINIIKTDYPQIKIEG